MVKVVKKKLYQGKKVVLGTGTKKGLVFIVDKKGKIADTLTTPEAKKIGLVKASKRKTTGSYSFGFKMF